MYSIERYFELVDLMPQKFVNNELIPICLNKDLLLKYQKNYNLKLGLLYENTWFCVINDLILQKNGSFFLYMRLLSKGEYTGSIIIPYCNNKILLLNQFRHGTRKFEYEFPRGGFEIGLSPLENAKKEIQEEIGSAVENMIFLGTTISDSSLGTGEVYIYKCYLPCIPTVFQKEEGIDSCILVSQKELLELVASNKIRDGFTLSAITKAISLGEL